MSEGPLPTQSVDLPVAVKVPKRTSLWWFVIPVLALIAAAIFLRPLLQGSQKTVTVTFAEVHGLREGAPVSWRGTLIGKVRAIEPKPNEGRITVEIQFLDEKLLRAFAHQDSKFWIERLQISRQGVRGAETVLGPRSIDAQPGSGAFSRTFVGLSDAPDEMTKDQGDIEVLLRAEHRGSLHPHAPVLYRGVRVGEVRTVRFSEDGRRIEAKAWIKGEYAKLISTRSVFWDDGAVDVELSMSRIAVAVGSPETLVTGGVAFITKPGGEAVSDGQQFSIERKPFLREPNPGDLLITLRSKVGASVKENGPITYRKLQVGWIQRVALGTNSNVLEINVVIDEPYATLIRANTQFWDVSGLKMEVGLTGAAFNVDSAQSLVAGGIAFATPNDFGVQAESGHSFDLLAEAPKKWDQWQPGISVGRR